MTERLAEEERRSLLRLARAAIEESLGARGSLERALAAVPLTAALHEPRGAFVTLKRGSPPALRGCIGQVEDPQPLYRGVIELARKSAFEDPRFAPLVQDELPDLQIEISILTPTRAIAGTAEIEVGRHGVQLERGAVRAVFLPQVPVERHWSVETLLRQLALKAGLSADGWRGARLAVFEAEVFGDAA